MNSNVKAGMNAMESAQMRTQTCTGCGLEFPLTRDYFGGTPSGGFRRKCRNCMASHARVHHQVNPEKSRSRAELRRHRQSAAGDYPTESELGELFIRQKGLCAYCMLPLGDDRELDHMTPIAKGGSNSIANLAFACSQCNKEKHAKTAFEYLVWRAKHSLPIHPGSFAYKLVMNE